jgi:hypothetical protein
MPVQTQACRPIVTVTVTVTVTATAAAAGLGNLELLSRQQTAADGLLEEVPGATGDMIVVRSNIQGNLLVLCDRAQGIGIGSEGRTERRLI